MSQPPRESAPIPAVVLALAYGPIALWLMAQVIEGNFAAGLIISSIAGSLCIWRIVRLINRPEKLPPGERRDVSPPVG